MRNSKLLIATAIATGLALGQVSFAQDGAHEANTPKAEKASCKGKSGCKHKGSCKHSKHHKKAEKKAEAHEAAPAEAAPAAPAQGE